jgi:hypothetical protein
MRTGWGQKRVGWEIIIRLGREKIGKRGKREGGTRM